jgi:hypothetical protein
VNLLPILIIALAINIIALAINQTLLLLVIYFLWRSNTRLREANHMIFLMKRRSTINEKHLEELRKNNKLVN